MGRYLYSLPLRKWLSWNFWPWYLIWVVIGRMLAGFHLMDSLYWRSRQTGCVITGILILYIGSGSKLMIVLSLVKVTGWSQALPWLSTLDFIHLLEYDFWVYILDIQRCNDTLSWETLSLGSTYLMGRWRHPWWVSFSLFIFRLVTPKSVGSALLQRYILIWHAVYVFLLSLGSPWSSFPLFHFGIGRWLHSRGFFDLVCLLTWWRSCRRVIRFLLDII